MDTTTITTGRLVLRPWEQRDIPAVQAACHDPQIARWTTVPSPYTERDAHTWCTSLSPEGWASGRAATFAVLDATGGHLVASVGLGGIDAGSAELGYWCAAPARGSGVVTEAAQALCRWGFGALGLRRITWRAEVGNWGSRAVADKLGFTPEGVRRRELSHGGEWVDAWAATLLADDQMADR